VHDILFFLGARRGLGVGYEFDEGEEEEAAEDYLSDDLNSIIEIDVLGVARGPAIEGQGRFDVPLESAKAEDRQEEVLASHFVISPNRLFEDVHRQRKEAAPVEGLQYYCTRSALR